MQQANESSGSGPRPPGASRPSASSAHLSAARAQQLLHITSAIADAVGEEELYAALVDEVAAAIGASSAGLWIVEPNSHRANLARSLGYSAEADSRLRSLALNAQPSTPVLDAIRGRAPIWIASQEELFARYPHLRAYASAGRLYRIAALPLMVGSEAVGALGLTCEGAPEALDEKEMLLLVARYASQSLQRLELLKAERHSRSRADAMARHWALLSQVSHTLAASNLNLKERLRVAAEELSRALGGCVNIGLLRADGAVQLTGVHHPDPAANAWLDTLSSQTVLRPGEGVTGAMLASGQSVLLPRIDATSFANQALPVFREFLRCHPVHALMGACLRVGERTIGTVTVTRTCEGETFVPEDVALLEALAGRAALAIHNGQLFQETRDAQKRAEQLYVFANAVMAAERVEQVFEAALSAIEGALDADRSAVLLFDDEGVMRFRRWRHLSDAYRARVEGHSPWEPGAKEPQPILIEDVQTAPSLASLRELLAREGIGALAFVPLVSDGKLLGKFMVYYDRSRRFAEHDLTTAHSVALHLAAAISRYAAQEELRARIRNNERLAAVLAHDLRNPLAAIMTAANLLIERSEVAADSAMPARSSPEAEILALSRVMRRSGQRMRAMIDQLLDFARARSGGGIGVEPKPCSLRAICSQACDEVALTHPQCQLTRSFDGDLEGTWDADRMLQVCSNLLTNAFHHGRPHTPVTLRVAGATSSAQVVLEVHNHGSIPPDVMERLFEPFYRGSLSERSSQGLGLGLFIVREIIVGHGGLLRVESSESSGTLFRVELPRHCGASRIAALRS